MLDGGWISSDCWRPTDVSVWVVGGSCGAGGVLSEDPSDGNPGWVPEVFSNPDRLNSGVLVSSPEKLPSPDGVVAEVDACWE